MGGGGTSEGGAVVGGVVLGVAPGTVVVVPGAVAGTLGDGPTVVVVPPATVVPVVGGTGSDVVVVAVMVVLVVVDDPLGAVELGDVGAGGVVDVETVVVVSSGGTSISCTAQPASRTTCPAGQFNPG